MKFIYIALMALFLFSCNRKISNNKSVAYHQYYITTKGDTILLGQYSKQILQQLPHGLWYNTNYTNYNIDSTTANQLKNEISNKRFEIFMGTWCGDSRREVPRMYKLLEYIGVKPTNIKLIMLDNRDSLYKQSPTHEEKGKRIHRVPTLLVYNKQVEINRIVELPVVSLEKDLLAIMKKQIYEPNYKAVTYLQKLLQNNDTIVIRKNIINNIEKLKTLTRNSSELNALGYVWMATGEMDKALITFELNTLLYPTIANTYDSLGEINAILLRKEEARKNYNKVLELEPGNSNALKMLEKLQ